MLFDNSAFVYRRAINSLKKNQFRWLRFLYLFLLLLVNTIIDHY
jgi:hypothetical protein